MLDGKTPAQKVEILTVSIAQWREMYALDPSPIISRKIRELEDELRSAELARKEQEADDELTRYERINFKDVKLMSSLDLEREYEGCKEITERVEQVRDDCYDPMGRALDDAKAKLFQCERVLINVANRADELRDEIEDRRGQVLRQQDQIAKRENAVGAAIPDREGREDKEDATGRFGAPFSPSEEEALSRGFGPDYDEVAEEADNRTRAKKKKPKKDPLDSKTPILKPETDKKTREIELDE